MKRSLLLIILCLLFHTGNAQLDMTYWPSGEIRSIASYENGQLKGPWRLYRKNGEIEQAREYIDKGKTSEWRMYYYTGELYSISLYKNGNPNDYSYRSFYKGGQLAHINILQNGIYMRYEEYYKHGVLKSSIENKEKGTRSSKEYYENGALKQIGNLSSYSKIGVWKTYFISGELKQTQEYADGKMTGTWKEYNQDGTLIQTQESVPNSMLCEVKKYYLSGQLKQTGRHDYTHSSTHPRIVGEWKEYHENGQLQRIYQFREGLKFGIWKKFHDDGSLSQIGEYKDGKPIGFWKDYYRNGELKTIGMYASNVYRMEKSGEWKDYHENGQLMRTCSHGYTGRGGEQREYYETGELKQIGYWGEADSQLGEWKDYRKNGQLKRITAYSEDVIISPIRSYFLHEKIVFTKKKVKKPYKYKDRMAEYEVGKSKFHYRNGNRQFVKKCKGDSRKNTYINYHVSGGVAAKEKIKNGDSIGYKKVYYQKGKHQLKWIFRQLEEEGETEKRLKIGEWKTYYENGKLHQVQLYRLGKLMEITSSFDREGNAQPIGTLKNGTGTVLVYNENEELINLIDYENGALKR